MPHWIYGRLESAPVPDEIETMIARDSSSDTKRGDHERRLPILTVIAVVAFYGWLVFGWVWEPRVNVPGRQPYNLLTKAFLSGQLHLPEPVPPGLTRLKDPYEPTANAEFRDVQIDGSSLHDFSYYRGKLYLYFGLTPVIVLFAPWHWLTGAYFPQEVAVLVFSSVGLITGAWLYTRIAWQYVPAAGPIAISAGLLAFGVAGGLPSLLLRPAVYEVAISCGFAFVMLALALIWKCLETASRRTPALALASLFAGLAVAARPSLLVSSMILVVPVAAAWRRKMPVSTLLWAAAIPITAVGVAVMLYNVARFDNPFEFGISYMLSGINVHESPALFSFEFVRYNLRVYFLEPVRWIADSIFPRGVHAPPPPNGHQGAENPFGILTSVPFAWLGLGTIAIARHSAGFRWIAVCLLMLFLGQAVTLSAFLAACTRYQAEFLPALMLLAGFGLLALEAGSPGPRKLRGAVRCACGLALVYSLLVGSFIGASAISRHRAMQDRNAWALVEIGERTRALHWFKTAAGRYPHLPAPQVNLALLHYTLGQLPEAVASFQRSLEINPHDDFVHYSVGKALALLGRTGEAEAHFRRALELNPQSPAAAELPTR
jgi:hypothetical protein